MKRGRKTTHRLGAVLVAGTIALAGPASCSKSSPPGEPILRATKAFEETFGVVPPLPLPTTSYAAVAYFPSTTEPGKFRPVPIFSVEQGKEEMLVVRTVIRGIGGGHGSLDTRLMEIARPFPADADLAAFSYEGDAAKVTVGGSFRADTLSGAQGEKAAEALALTISQFGKAGRVDVTDASGTARFRASAGDAEVVDIGSPKALGLLAIREAAGKPPGTLSVLFDRPVFIEDAAFFLPGKTAPLPGKVYSTGFGMSLEFHPEPETSFDPGIVYRVRLAVRDGKGRKASMKEGWKPKEVARH